MGTIAEVIAQGHVDKADQTGWEVEVSIFDANGRTVKQEVTAGLTWGKAIGLSFQRRQELRAEGYDKGFFALTHTASGWRATIKIGWRGLPQLPNEEEAFDEIEKSRDGKNFS